MIQKYFYEVKEWIYQHRSLVLHDELDFRVDEELDIGLIKGKISFVDGSSLYISESLNLEKPSYRFHFMDAQTRAFKRWDSSPHFKKIKTFPYHFHDGEKIKPSKPKTSLEILELVKRIVLDNISKL
ncbi:MAG: DUF6516 family protein [candidate division Zixibacteria bacterium]|nr:DUF6516 family protein [candidate division Zixibacteria bacterium]